MKCLSVVTLGLSLSASLFASDVNALKEKALLYLPMEEGKILASPSEGVEVKPIAGTPVFYDGKKGKGLVIDDQGISIKGLEIVGNNLMKGEEGTIVFWMKPLVKYTGAGKGRQYFLVCREYLGGGMQGNGKYLYIDSPSGSFMIQCVKDKSWKSDFFNFNWWKKPQWSPELWYHVAVTWGPSSTTTFYLNGAPIHKGKKAGQLTAAQNANKLMVGCSLEKNKSSNAILDEYYVFDKMLTQEEISLLMNDK